MATYSTVTVKASCDLGINDCDEVLLCLDDSWADKTVSGCAFVVGSIVTINKAYVIKSTTTCGEVQNTCSSPILGKKYCNYIVKITLDDQTSIDPDTELPFTIENDDIEGIVKNLCLYQKLIDCLQGTGGAGNPAPPDMSIQYNLDGVFGGDGNFIYNYITQKVGLGILPDAYIDVYKSGAIPDTKTIRGECYTTLGDCYGVIGVAGTAGGNGFPYALYGDCPGTGAGYGWAGYFARGDVATQNKFGWRDGAGLNFTFIQGYAAFGSDIVWTLPPLQGGAGTVFTNDGAGNLSWEVPAGNPAAPDKSVQYNNGGVFGGFGAWEDSYKNLQFDTTNSNIKIGFEAGLSTAGADNNILLGYQSGKAITSGGANILLGLRAGSNITTGGNNNIFGVDAGSSPGGTNQQNNNFFGYQAGRDNQGTDNNFFGTSAGHTNTTGHDNNFFGNTAGYSNTVGFYNNFFGFQTGYNNLSGNYNNFFGSFAGFTNTIGNNNNFYGPDAGIFNTTGSNNNFFGNSAGRKNTTGDNNVCIGNSAGFNNQIGNNNFCLGAFAGYGIATDNNVAIGSGALGGDPYTGIQNTAIGNNALAAMQSGSANTAVGYGNIRTLTTGDENVALGNDIMPFMTTGIQNVGIGGAPLNSLLTGNQNIAIGEGALIQLTSGDGNTGIGARTLWKQTTASSNTALGIHAGFNFANSDGNLTGNRNTFLGADSGTFDGVSSLTALNRSTAIGYNSQVLFDNTLALGETGANVTQIGFPSATDPFRTYAVGGAQVGDIFWALPIVQGAANTALTNDGSGVLSWESSVTIAENVSLTGLTAVVNTTSFVGATTPGLYRVNYYIATTTADGAAGTIQLSVSFTDDAGATTVTSSALALTALGRTSGVFYVQLASGTLAYETILGGIIGTSAYSLYMTCEKLL